MVAGFNAAVAKAHGYKINPSSRLPKRPILRRSHGMAATAASNTDYNQLVGNCGLCLRWRRDSR